MQWYSTYKIMSDNIELITMAVMDQQEAVASEPFVITISDLSHQEIKKTEEAMRELAEAYAPIFTIEDDPGTVDKAGQSTLFQ